ncbi:hypothetical protein SDC9_135793 [bioreactor metagenome]|uniref:Uncharacterized protein n=1 Tax=bioreactor metagenome TaxID=1076179 RepID=A0A645DHC6_9ZZZZ
MLRGSDVWHEGYHWGAPNGHAEQQHYCSQKEEKQTLGSRQQDEGGGCNGGANEDEGQTAANAGAQVIRPGAYGRLNEQGGDIIQSHEHADESGRQRKTIL